MRSSLRCHRRPKHSQQTAGISVGRLQEPEDDLVAFGGAHLTEAPSHQTERLRPMTGFQAY